MLALGGPADVYALAMNRGNESCQMLQRTRRRRIPGSCPSVPLSLCVVGAALCPGPRTAALPPVASNRGSTQYILKNWGTKLPLFSCH